jgi:type II secretory pathway component PulF
MTLTDHEQPGNNGDGPGKGPAALSSEEVARLSGQIALLARTGLPLSTGLTALGEELPAGGLRAAIENLAVAIEAGQPLEQAIKSQGDHIPPHIQGLVIAGVRSGRLGDLLGRYASYSSVRHELHRKLWLSLAYPLLSMVAALALFLFVCVFLVRQFEMIFRDFGVPLPTLTIVILRIAAVANQIWPVVLIIAVALLIGWLGSRLFLNEKTRGQLAAHIPLIGRIWRCTALSEFFHLLALLLESEMKLPEALDLAGRATPDADVETAAARMATEIRDGAELAVALRTQRLIPSGVPPLVEWGQKAGDLPSILHAIAEMFEAKAPSLVTFAGTVFGVLALLAVLWGVFLVVCGLILPMINLISVLSG